MKWKPLPLREENLDPYFGDHTNRHCLANRLEVWTVPDTPQALERVLEPLAQFFSQERTLIDWSAAPTSDNLSGSHAW